MGVVRRNGDWRLEKRDEGVYEITYQQETQMKVLTSEYNPGMMGGPMIDAIPVREVDSYPEAEGMFEEMVHDSFSAGMGPPNGGDVSSVELGIGEAVDLGSSEEDAFEEFDLPPGGIAFALLVAGGMALRYAGFSPESTVFLIGAAMAIGAVAILGWAGVLYKTNGWSEAYEFLVAVNEESSQNVKTDESETTPPTPEKLKNKLIFDRAGQQCEWCEESFDHPEVHHIKPRREAGPNKPENLIVLCPNCHEKADREAIPRSKLKAKMRRLPEVSSK